MKHFNASFTVEEKRNSRADIGRAGGVSELP